MIRERRIKTVFITGTDTHVGKTYFTIRLVRELTERGLCAAALKPVACGRCGRRDAMQYRRIAGKSIPLDEINPYWFGKPLSPLGQQRNPRISLSRIRRSCLRAREARDSVLVEGAGGLLTPLTRKISVRDMARALDAPVVIVARAGLGTLNHTMLTVEAAHAGGLKVLAVVLNDQDGTLLRAAAGNRRVLRRLLPCPVLVETFDRSAQKK